MPVRIYQRRPPSVQYWSYRQRFLTSPRLQLVRSIRRRLLNCGFVTRIDLVPRRRQPTSTPLWLSSSTKFLSAFTMPVRLFSLTPVTILSIGLSPSFCPQTSHGSREGHTPSREGLAVYITASLCLALLCVSSCARGTVMPMPSYGEVCLLETKSDLNVGPPISSPKSKFTTEVSDQFL